MRINPYKSKIRIPTQLKKKTKKLIKHTINVHALELPFQAPNRSNSGSKNPRKFAKLKTKTLAHDFFKIPAKLRPNEPNTENSKSLSPGPK